MRSRRSVLPRLLSARAWMWLAIVAAATIAPAALMAWGRFAGSG
jgi:hypothetical protein